MQFAEFLNMDESSQDYFARVLVLILQQLSIFSNVPEESVFPTSFFLL